MKLDNYTDVAIVVSFIVLVIILIKFAERANKESHLDT